LPADFADSAEKIIKSALSAKSAGKPFLPKAKQSVLIREIRGKEKKLRSSLKLPKLAAHG
jgi:hypothetical protein